MLSFSSSVVTSPAAAWVAGGELSSASEASSAARDRSLGSSVILKLRSQYSTQILYSVKFSFEVVLQTGVVKNYNFMYKQSTIVEGVLSF